jgi:hypothetical protein
MTAVYIVAVSQQKEFHSKASAFYASKTVFFLIP